MTPSEKHAYDAGRFAELVAAAAPDDWSNPSPVPEWTALDVVAHLVEWSRDFLRGAGVDLPAIDVAADPVAAWKQHTSDIQALLDDPGDRVLSNPHVGDVPLAEAIDRFYTGDVWLHSWDLSRALGIEFDLGADRAAAGLVAMEPMDDVLRKSGQFGPKVDVPADASPQDRLVGFIGRDPSWDLRSPR